MRSPRWWRSTQPQASLAVPRTSGVIPPPVLSQTERHDGQAQTGTVVEDRNPSALVVEIQVIGVDPAAIALPVHIAPGPVVQTSVDVDIRVSRKGQNEGVVTARPRAQMH